MKWSFLFLFLLKNAGSMSLNFCRTIFGTLGQKKKKNNKIGMFQVVSGKTGMRGAFF